MAWKAGASDIRKWRDELCRLSDQIGPRFGRLEIRQRTWVYLEVLLSNVPRKNGWQLAEHAGDATPKNIQHFLRRAKWDADEVRDDLQQYVVQHLRRGQGQSKRASKSIVISGRLCAVYVFRRNIQYFPGVFCDDDGAWRLD